jgi:flagellar motor protein MotB
MRPLAALCLALCLAGCSASLARPAVLDEAAAASQTAASREAAQLAPLTHAEAEKLRKEAEAAQAAGDPSSAQILAEQAIAVHARAFAQARLLRSQQATDDLQKPLEQAATDLQQLRAEQQLVTSELQDLELKIKVLREAPPVVASGPSRSAGREAARREAAQALLTEARLLCLSSRLVAAEGEGLKDAEAALGELARKLEDPRQAAPIDDAMRARAQCLEALTLARRASASEESSGDALLAELGRASFAPVREDRGVVVTLRGAFSGDKLSARGSEQLESLGRVAAAHGKFPVVLVVHNAEPGRSEALKRDARRAETLKQAMNKHRSDRVEVHLAGGTRPVADPTSKKDRERNERVEIVFVDLGG